MVKYKITVSETGGKFWYLNGDHHRTSGPAIEHFNGTRHWFVRGNLHRSDGPATEYFGGRFQWFIEGRWVSKEEYKKEMCSE